MEATLANRSLGSQRIWKCPRTANGDAAAKHSGEESDDDADEHVTEATAAAGEGGAKKKKALTVQTEPPSVLISKLFPNNNYPKGEEVEYMDENRYRTTAKRSAIWTTSTTTSSLITAKRLRRIVRSASGHRKTSSQVRRSPRLPMVLRIVYVV